MIKKRWLCHQMIITKKGVNTEMETLIRDVGAKTKEEAIGKFILQTAYVKAMQKLNPICFELNTLMMID